jgi:hypothetical protein
LFRNEECDQGERTSSVLFLLGEHVPENGGAPEVCIILNKRSKEVRQSGDLCCPGGAVETPFDRWFARLLVLPRSPLSRWKCWGRLRRERPEDAEFLSLLFAAGVRESWEEMRLNPLGITFLGPMPSQCLVLFRRVIHPLAVWVSRQKNYTLSWEVEKVVYIPLRELLNPFNYAVHRRYVPPHLEWRFRGTAVDFPCFLHYYGGRAEMLWGATYRIVTLFMEMVFGFVPPDPAGLPMVPASLGDEYVNGKAFTTENTENTEKRYGNG